MKRERVINTKLGTKTLENEIICDRWNAFNANFVTRCLHRFPAFLSQVSRSTLTINKSLSSEKCQRNMIFHRKIRKLLFYRWYIEKLENDNFRARQFLPIVISTFQPFLFFNSYHGMVIRQCDHERAHVETRPFRVLLFCLFYIFFKWAHWSVEE